ncbi:hypothetical protein LCGC14_2136930 [marine sediment metagenome]|uniref:Tail assembly chaperone n=1 Tax=marine sediment metagenome TaxID=412755 RepID=A0A0F9DZT9_9ZZZZ
MTFDLQKEFATDEKSELEGAWEELAEGARILVARVGNDHYTERFKRLGKGLQRQIDRGTLPEKKGRTIFIAIMVDTILLNWEGLADKGQPIEYSKENARTMLQAYPDFRQLVWDIASDADLYRIKDREEDLGNSSAPSSSDSDTPTKN